MTFHQQLFALLKPKYSIPSEPVARMILLKIRIGGSPMRLRELLIGAAVMSLGFVSAKASTPPEPSALISEDKILGSAYYDTLSILSTPNECSDFFGGSASSVDGFNGLMGNARKDYFTNSIGIRMTGATVNVFNMRTRSKYRIFSKVSINGNGPFYRRKFSVTQPTVPGVGTFAANTKEARVLMFLHELGHVVQSGDGKWLLPDDGGNDELSRENTRKIESVCGNQIKSLGKGDTVMNLASGKQKPLDEKLTAVDKTLPRDNE
jgi:hypothetical protein